MANTVHIQVLGLFVARMRPFRWTMNVRTRVQHDTLDDVYLVRALLRPMLMHLL